MLKGFAKGNFEADTPDGPDRALRAWLSDYARRHGWQANNKEIHHLWAEEGLRVVRKRSRKRIGVSRIPAVVAEKANDVWSVDFQFDSTISGKPVKVLSIVDEHTRECLEGIVNCSITGLDLAEQLAGLAIARGMPKALRVFIPPSKPWRNGYAESFNGKLRDECLSVNQFTSLNHAKGIISVWKEEYNTIRAQPSLGPSTPSVYVDGMEPPKNH